MKGNAETRKKAPKRPRSGSPLLCSNLRESLLARKVKTLPQFCGGGVGLWIFYAMYDGFAGFGAGKTEMEMRFAVHG